MEKLESKSLNIGKNNIEKIKEYFPSCVKEEKIDFDILRQLLGDDIDEAKEKYQFIWNGKAQAIKNAQTPSSSTLRPCMDKSKNWETTQNLYIEGDNLEVLKQLQKTYFGKIKAIYIDPPYNTGHDFVYKDNFTDSFKNYIEQTNQINSSNPETSGRFHTDWLNMMYPRISLARNLLKENGAMFISIDDNEIDNLKKICVDVFGEDNVEQMIWDKITGNDNAGSGKMKITYRFRKDHEYIVVCYKNKNECLFNKPLRLRKTKNEYNNVDNDPRGNWISSEICKSEEKSNPDGKNYFTFTNPQGNSFTRQWHYSKEELEELVADNRIYFGDGTIIPRLKKFLSEPAPVTPSSVMSGIASQTDGNKDLEKYGIEFDNPKPLKLMEWIIELIGGDNEIVLDFFSGSATTGEAVFNLKNKFENLKFILVQLPELIENETICDRAINRLNKSGEYLKNMWIESNKGEGLFEKDVQYPYDIGYKVYALDSTNIKAWDNSAIQDESNLLDYNEIFKEGRTKEDVLYETMLKYGIFDQQATIEKINGKDMFKVGSRYMIVCLEDEITSNDVKKIGEFKPRVVVFKESGFANDNDKINAVYNLEKAGVEDIRCI